MMTDKKSDLEIITFDIETTGFHPCDDDPLDPGKKIEIVSWCANDYGIIQDKTHTEESVLRELSSYFMQKNKQNTRIVTFMGGTSRGTGFDFPFLRTVFTRYDVLWPFLDFNHVDMFPIIQQHYDLDYSELGVLKDFSAPELKKMAIHFGLKAESTMALNIASITEMVEQYHINEYIKEKGEMKNKTHNTLKDACLLLLKIKGFDIDGSIVPKMFAEWKKTGDDSILKTIMEYNKDDCIKTRALYEEAIKTVSRYEMRGKLL